MSIPLSQQAAIATYLISKKLKGEKRYPLTLMLEPLFQCNLECPGCGKIDYASHILKQRLSVEECMRAVDECGAPVVSLAGGEPLVHQDIKAIVDGFLARGKFIYLCTNAILLEKKLDLFTPSDHFTFSVHLDGMRERHDESVGREGVFDIATKAIREAKRRGFRVNINTTLFTTANPKEVADFFDFATNDLKVDGITASPGYHYDHAPKQEVFLGRTASKELFRGIFRLKKDRGAKWPMSHSGLFIDFVCGNQDYQCTPWSMPCRNVFGWQKPCYLLVDEGYEPTFKDLMEKTDWDSYGVGRNPKCANCMAHCGFEGTAAEDSFNHPLKAAMVSFRGPRLEGPFAPDRPLMYDPSNVHRGQVSTITAVPLSSIAPAKSAAPQKEHALVDSE